MIWVLISALLSQAATALVYSLCPTAVQGHLICPVVYISLDIHLLHKGISILFGEGLRHM